MSMQLHDSREGITDTSRVGFSASWKARTPLERRLFVVNFILTITTVTLLVTVVVLGVRKNRPIHDSLKTCNSTDASTINYDCQEHLTLAYNCTDCREEKYDCNNPKCLRYSLSILEAMNTSVDPCEDFYLYACGNYIANNEVMEGREDYTTLTNLELDNEELILEILMNKENGNDSTAIGKARTMYKACYNKDGYENQSAILNLLTKYGDWSALNGTREENRTWDDVMKRMAVGTGLGGLDGILRVSVTPNFNNNTQYIIYIAETDQMRPLDTSNENTTSNAIKNILTKLNAQNKNILDEVAQGIIKVNKFIVNLLKNIRPKGENFSENYKFWTIAELDHNTKCQFKWETYFKILLNVTQPTIDVNSSMLIGVQSSDYFENFCANMSEYHLADNITTEQLMDYITFQFIRDLLLETNSMRDLRAEEQLVLQPQKGEFDISIAKKTLCQIPAKDHRCLMLVNRAFPYAIANELATKTLPETNRLIAENITEQIITLIKKTLEENEWMDEATKEGALKKINALKKYYVYPEWVGNKTEVDNFYQELNISDNHFSNYINDIYERRRKNLNLLVEPPKLHLWDETPSAVNAYYSPQENSINIQLGIFRPPIVERERLNAMNFASLGSIIGHEITHGFDLKGRQFDENGNLRNWWTDKVSKTFLQKAKCFEDQYDNFTLNKDYFPGKEIKINGSQTISENIADNGGVQQAFWVMYDKTTRLEVVAFQKKMQSEGKENPPYTLKNFTIDQVFFLSYANMWCVKYAPRAENTLAGSIHSPNPFRVLGPLQNFPEFSKAFNCPKGSKMNPDKQPCKLW